MLLLYQNRSTVDNTFLLAQLLTVSIVLHPFILDKCYFWNSIDARTRFVSLKRHQIALRGPFSLQQRVDFNVYQLRTTSMYPHVTTYSCVTRM